MEEITPDNLKAKVETLSKACNFPIRALFAAKDDYSLPEVEALGLSRRAEILIGCEFSHKIGHRRVSLEYRVFEGKFGYFIATIQDMSFKDYPEARQIIGESLSKVGIGFQLDVGRIVAQLDPPSMDTVETFLSTYFRAQKQTDEYIRERIRLNAELRLQYSIR